MKKTMMLLAFVFGAVAVTNAQTEEGGWIVEANTGFGNTFGSIGNTGFGLTSVDGETAWNLGAEAGKFVSDDLAIKAGLGYGSDGDFSIFSYKAGAKYYVNSKFPVAVDVVGASLEDFDENPLYAGVQAGYAWFAGEQIAIEFGPRYNVSLNDDFSDEGIFEFKAGFSLFF